VGRIGSGRNIQQTLNIEEEPTEEEPTLEEEEEEVEVEEPVEETVDSSEEE